MSSNTAHLRPVGPGRDGEAVAEGAVVRAWGPERVVSIDGRPIRQIPAPLLPTAAPAEVGATPAIPTQPLGPSILRIVAERWVVAGVTMAVVAALGAMYGMSQPSVYEATATVAVTSASSSVSKSLPETDINTELYSARSPELAEQVIEKLKLEEEPETLTAHLTVSAPSSSGVLQFTYSSRDPQKAADMANEYARQYLENRKTRLRDQIDEMSKSLQAQLDKIPDDKAHQIQRQSIATQMSTLSQAFVAGYVSSGATAPSKPAQPLALAYTGAGLAAGVILGVLAAALADRLDPRVRHRRRLTAIYSGPVVATDKQRAVELAGRLVVLLRSAATAAPITRVAVLSAQRRTGDAVVSCLQDELATEAVRVDGLSYGAPIHWFDARDTHSLASRLDAATSVDATVLVVGRKDRRAAVREVVGAMAEVGRRPTCCLYVTRRTDREES